MRLARNMISAPPVHRTPPRTDWYPELEQSSTPDMPPTKDSPHDVVIKIDKLDGLIKTLFGIVCALIAVIYYHSTEENKDRKAEIKILESRVSKQESVLESLNVQQNANNKVMTSVQEKQQLDSEKLNKLDTAAQVMLEKFTTLGDKVTTVSDLLRKSLASKDSLIDANMDSRHLNGYEKAK
jgi:uncharacterized coiled-coil protein SlyX